MHDTRKALSAPPTALMPTPDEPGSWSLVVPTDVIALGPIALVGVAEVWSAVLSAN